MFYIKGLLIISERNISDTKYRRNISNASISLILCTVLKIVKKLAETCIVKILFLIKSQIYDIVVDTELSRILYSANSQ